jgi:hypothetical protein
VTVREAHHDRYLHLRPAPAPGHRNPLSQCKVASVDGMRGDHPPANTTVYLTVAC